MLRIAPIARPVARPRGSSRRASRKVRPKNQRAPSIRNFHSASTTQRSSILYAQDGSQYTRASHAHIADTIHRPPRRSSRGRSAAAPRAIPSRNHPCPTSPSRTHTKRSLRSPLKPTTPTPTRTTSFSSTKSSHGQKKPARRAKGSSRSSSPQKKPASTRSAPPPTSTKQPRRLSSRARHSRKQSPSKRTQPMSWKLAPGASRTRRLRTNASSSPRPPTRHPRGTLVRMKRTL